MYPRANEHRIRPLIALILCAALLLFAWNLTSGHSRYGALSLPVFWIALLLSFQAAWRRLQPPDFRELAVALRPSQARAPPA